MNNNKYFSVTCLRAHVGRKAYTSELYITFVFEAANLLEAMDYAKRMPGVKHSRPVLKANQISFEEYNIKRQKSAYTPI